MIAFLNQQKTNSTSGVAHYYATFEDLYDRKLWHQLTKRIEEFVREGNFSEGDELLQLYSNFVVDFEQKLNKLSLAQFTLAASRQLKDPREAIAFLQKISEKLQKHTETFVMIVMETASHQLAVGDIAACKKAIEDSEKLLDSLPGVEPIIHASFYRVFAAYDQFRGNYDGFYKNSLLFLACVSLDSLSQEEKVERTYNLGIAALLGQSIYNFGELLAHDILTILQGTKHEWLMHALRVFNAGSIAEFQNLRHIFQQEPLLAGNMDFLEQKIRLMCLIETIFQLSGDKRNLGFKAIAEGMHLSGEQVEHLLMRAMSLKLIRGVIDQVEETVSISWVQPRVLDRSQIAALRSRLDQWSTGVDSTVALMEKETPDLLAQ